MQPRPPPPRGRSPSYAQTGLERLAADARREGTLRALALALRHAAAPPGTRRERLYRRLVRPLGRRLPRPRAAPAVLAGITTWHAPAPGPIARIVVLKLDHIGDFLLAAPALHLLRTSFPHAAITLICAPWNRLLAERSGLVDRVVTHDFFAERAEAGRIATPRPLPPLDGPFDLAIDLRVDPDTRPLLARLPARLTAGYWCAAMPELDIALPPPDATRGDQHQRRSLLAVVAAVIARIDPARAAEDVLRRLAAGSAEKPTAIPPARPGPVVAFSIGSGRAIKNWPLDRFIALARIALAEGAGTVLLLGGIDQAAEARLATAALADPRVVDLVATSGLDASIAALARADIFVGNDTGLGHAAAALGLRTLVLFAGIDPLASWAPLGRSVTVLKADISCAPCHLLRLQDCRQAHRCMTAITVADVAAALRPLLAGSQRDRLNATPSPERPWT